MNFLMRARPCALYVLLGTAWASLPTPFSGSYGATVGAGSAVAWERQSFGGNPAALNPNSLGFAVAGYSPFGLDAVTVMEAGAHADSERWGASLTYRGDYVRDEGATSAWQMQAASRWGSDWTSGFSLRYQDEEGWNAGSETGGALGILWHGLPFFTAGALAEETFTFNGLVLGLGYGADWGTRFAGGAYAWRFCVEGFSDSNSESLWRMGGEVDLHASLSLYGGWSPQLSTWALGARFGMGHWQGFHALRRHAALGSTSLESGRWTRPWTP